MASRPSLSSKLPEKPACVWHRVCCQTHVTDTGHGPFLSPLQHMGLWPSVHVYPGPRGTQSALPPAFANSCARMALPGLSTAFSLAVLGSQPGSWHLPLPSGLCAGASVFTLGLLCLVHSAALPKAGSGAFAGVWISTGSPSQATTRRVKGTCTATAWRASRHST